jgi:hypothetical protein
VLPKRGRPFKVRCDWSKKGVGGVHLQEDDAGVERVVSYRSRSCNGAKSRYSSFEGELLAAVYFVRLWRLYGERFQLESDHQPLQWILTNSKLTGKLARWALMLSEFDFEVVHKPGIDNEMDCLSRFPQAETHDSTGVRQEGTLEGGAMLTWLAAACLAWTGGGEWSRDAGQTGLRPEGPEAGGSPGLKKGAGSRACQRQPGGVRAGPEAAAAALTVPSCSDTPAPQVAEGPRLEGARAAARAGPRTPGAQLGAEGTTLEGTRPGGGAVSVSAAPVQDVWQDLALLALLRGHGYPLGCSRRERDRLQHRARGFEWRGTHLVRLLASGEVRVVPKLAAGRPLIHDVHERSGHVVVMKTTSLLTPHYWWLGLFADVARVVGGCSECDRVRAAFNVKHPTLQPLPIKGLFYRWGLDFAGPLPKSSGGNRYVLVMVEHFSKTMVLVPTRDKEPGTVAAILTREVLTHYGACAEVVTDRGGEFGGAFQSCLDAALIDHRSTSAYHPQANGLSERVVQVVKRALRKWCLRHAAEEWDAYLPWVAMGYNFSAQASLPGFSPYQLLYGRDPVVHGAIKVALVEPLDLDQPARLEALVAQRAALFQRWMPMALGNLQIAQHRDTLRYAKTRSGAWKPSLVQFAVGDYVYHQREMLDTLDTRAGERTLRVRAVAENGVLELEGSDARTVRVHVERCAPCHRVDIDGRVDPRRAVPSSDFSCRRCQRSTGVARMLLCDGCGAGWHLECLPQPLSAVPDGDWYCGRC